MTGLCLHIFWLQPRLRVALILSIIARRLQRFQESQEERNSFFMCVSFFFRLENLSKKNSHISLVRTGHKPTPKPILGKGGMGFVWLAEVT